MLLPWIVDLSGLNFVQVKRIFIATLVMLYIPKQLEDAWV
jgi:hypothetical protein